MNRSISIFPPSAFTLRFLYGVALLFCGFLFYLYFNSTGGLELGKAMRQLPGILIAVGLTVLLVGLIVWAVKRRSVTLTDSELIIRAGFYTRRVNRSSLRVQSGLVTSLFNEPSIAPRWRTNGIRVPGFRAGWFRLVNREKALVLLTDPQVVTYLPTTDGFALLISTGELLAALGEHPLDAGQG